MNGQILLMSLFKQKLPNGWCVVDRIIALDRGYDKLINWLISIGFDILHTKQRSPDFIFTFGLSPNSKLKGRVNIPEQGEMGAYWAKKTSHVKTATGQRKVTMWALAFRGGTGSATLS